MNYKGRRVLVTGGAGFIGSHMVERLHSEGADITVVDNLSAGSIKNLVEIMQRIDVIVGELNDVLQLRKVDLGTFDYVFHFAGSSYVPSSIDDPSRDYALNATNTFSLLQALRSTTDTPRLVNMSSAAVYGNPCSFLIRECDPTVPISPYGASKLAAERYVDVYCRVYGLRAASARPFSVYGPRQRKQVVYDLIQRLRANSRRLKVLGDGTQVRDFVHVNDVVEALLLIGLLAPCHGEVYNIASGTSHTIAELVNALCAVAKEAPEIVYSGAVRPGDPEKWMANIDRLHELGFTSAVTLEAGLADVLEWYNGECV